MERPKMTAHEKCIKKLQEMLRGSARKLEELADRLPEDLSPYPLSKYELEIQLMNDGHLYPFPMIYITHSCWAPREEENADGA